MLNQLFPDLFSQTGNGSTGLSSGATPGQLDSPEKEHLAAYASLPHAPSQKDVDSVAKKAGELEGTTALLKEYSEYAILAQQAANNNLDIRVGHAEKAMINETAFRKKLAKHGKNFYAHKIQTSAVSQNLNGYESAMKSASENVSF